MFKNTYANPDVSGWDTAKAWTFGNMFYGAQNANPDTSGWNIVKATSIQNIFYDSDISNANYSKFLIMAEDTCSNPSNCFNATINFGTISAKYYSGRSATAKATLMTNGWSINDDGESSNFDSVWQTTVDNESITIPTSGVGYDYTINWDDPNDSSDDGPSTATNPSHVYSVPGDYTVSISGTFPRIKLSGAVDAAKIISIPHLGNVGWTSFEEAFKGCENLGEIYGGDTSDVTTMFQMFRSTPMVDPDTSDWDVSNVTDMSYMFRDSSANPDTSNWNTSNVTNMAMMFADMETPYYLNTHSNLDTSSWNTSNVTNMNYMFYNSSANPDVSDWDTSSLTCMYTMFLGAQNANPDTSSWNVGNVAKTPAQNPDDCMWEIFNGSGISNDNYSNFLIMAEDTSDRPNMYIGNVPAQYNTGDAAISRQNLIDDHGWNLTGDDGEVP